MATEKREAMPPGFTGYHITRGDGEGNASFHAVACGSPLNGAQRCHALFNPQSAIRNPQCLSMIDSPARLFNMPWSAPQRPAPSFGRRRYTT
jgi:hypothetical protein